MKHKFNEAASQLEKGTEQSKLEKKKSLYPSSRYRACVIETMGVKTALFVLLAFQFGATQRAPSQNDDDDDDDDDDEKEAS